MMEKGDREIHKKEIERNLNPDLEQEIKASLVDGRLPCAVAFKVAKKMKVPPIEVGDAANRLKIKIVKCQLGCFK